MSNFHIFNDYYTLIVAFLMKQMQNRNRRFPNTPLILGNFDKIDFKFLSLPLPKKK